MMVYAALCTRPNGEVCRVWASNTEITFEGIATFSIPTWPLFLMAAATDTEVVAIGQDHDTGQATLIRQNGDRRALGATSGILCVGLRRAGDRLLAVWVTVGAQEYWEADIDHLTFDADGNVIPDAKKPILGAQGTSQGFISFDPDGTPRWTDTHRAITIHGTLLTLYWPTVNGWTVGQSNSDYDGVKAVSASGVVKKVAEAPIQVPPQAVAHPDGSIEACYSFDVSDPRSLFVPEAQWQDVTPPPIEPPIDPPPVDPPPVDPPPTDPGCADLLRTCQDVTVRLTDELAAEREAHRQTTLTLVETQASLDAALQALGRIPIWIRRFYRVG